MSKEYTAAILNVSPDDLVEVVTGKNYDGDVPGTIRYEMTANPLLKRCNMMYDNKVKRCNGDVDRIAKVEQSRAIAIQRIMQG